VTTGRRRRETRHERGEARDVAAVFAGLRHAAHYDVADFLGLEVVALDDFRDDFAGEVVVAARPRAFLHDGPIGERRPS
jgi:hypothetical protein